MSRLNVARNGLVALAFALLPVPVMAQEKYPSRPIEMIVPVVPGGGVDTSFRALADLVEKSLGQKVVVLNKPGASGTLGVSLVAQAKPDGYTIGGLWNAPLTMAPHLLDVSYTPKDYVAAGMVTTAPMIMCAKKDFPAKSGKEFIELLRKEPNKYTYGTDGVGGIVHLSFERAFLKLSVQARAIPFKGAAETLTAFLGDHINLYGGSIAPMQQYMANGTVNCLIVTAAERNAAAPNTDSLGDLGVPGEATANWRGVIVPKAMPADRIAILEHAFVEAANSESFKMFMESRGEEAKGLPASAMQKQLDAEYDAFGVILRAAGLAKKP